MCTALYIWFVIKRIRFLCPTSLRITFHPPLRSVTLVDIARTLQGSSECGPLASSNSWQFLEMPALDLTQPDTLGVGPAGGVLISCPQDSATCWSLRITGLADRGHRCFLLLFFVFLVFFFFRSSTRGSMNRACPKETEIFSLVKY